MKIHWDPEFVDVSNFAVEIETQADIDEMFSEEPTMVFNLPTLSGPFDPSEA